LSQDADLTEVRNIVAAHRHARWPVVNPGTGTVVGYLLTADLMGLEPDGGAWTTLVRPLLRAAPDDDLESTLLRFQREGEMIYLVEERDSSVGIITIEDILEQLVGNIQNEQEPRDRVPLRNVIITNDALLSLSSETSEQAVAEMVAKMQKGQLPPGVDVVKLALERERELPTNIGCGVAIPHARCPSLAAPVVILGRSTRGVFFNRQLPELVHLIFLLITPVECVDEQLFLLSEIAGIAGNPEKRTRLNVAASVTEVLDIVGGET
jgi:mannitol/fructose-specific phosphotransferase system IIA component (Ntr-type)/predicted transcriptional regulator